MTIEQAEKLYERGYCVVCGNGQIQEIKKEENKVTPNVKIHPDQLRKIKEMAKQTNNTYSDMFRMVLSVGLQTWKSDIIKKKVEE